MFQIDVQPREFKELKHRKRRATSMSSTIESTKSSHNIAHESYEFKIEEMNEIKDFYHQIQLEY